MFDLAKNIRKMENELRTQVAKMMEEWSDETKIISGISSTTSLTYNGEYFFLVTGETELRDSDDSPIDLSKPFWLFCSVDELISFAELFPTMVQEIHSSILAGLVKHETMLNEMKKYLGVKNENG